MCSFVRLLISLKELDTFYKMTDEVEASTAGRTITRLREEEKKKYFYGNPDIHLKCVRKTVLPNGLIVIRHHLK